MAREVDVTVTMPTRLYKRLQCRAANAGLSIETAILHCVEQNALLVHTGETVVRTSTQPGSLWAENWRSRWGELPSA